MYLEAKKKQYTNNQTTKPPNKQTNKMPFKISIAKRQGPFFMSEAGAKWVDYEGKLPNQYKVEYNKWYSIQRGRTKGIPMNEMPRTRKGKKGTRTSKFYDTDLGAKWKDYKGILCINIKWRKEYEKWKRKSTRTNIPRGEFLKSVEGAKWKDTNGTSTKKEYKQDFYKWKKRITGKRYGKITEEQYEAQKARQNVKITCECGKMVSSGNLRVHTFSKFHTNWTQCIPIE